MDIETSPNLVHVWSLWNQNVSLSQLQQSGSVIAFAAKWYGQNRVEFRSDFHDGHGQMVERAHRLLSEADVLVHYNGRRFDVPHLHREFLLAGLHPPAPFQQVDLLDVVKRRFKFVSNKLQHVAEQLELGSKVSHSGHDLWVRCMADDPKAWATMRRYNVGDVRLTEALYDRLLPWITNHPHHGLYSGGEHACPNCGGQNLKLEGFTFTAVSKFQRYSCRDCGKWSRGARAVARVDERGTA